MRDAPDAATLRALAEASAGRGEEPELVARARSIAAREEAAGTAPVEAIRRQLAQRYGEAGIETLLARFAAEIRAGVFDLPGPAQQEMLRLLREITLRKLAESNPDYLAAVLRA